MIEVRLAKKGDIKQQKEIWKLCFGDSEEYINLYYSNRYSENGTVVLLCDGVIAAMLAMIPARIVTPDDRSVNSSILYAIATRPKYRNRGFARKIIDFSSTYLAANNIEFSILVPAGQQLFEFYQKNGYQSAFYIRETMLARETIEARPNIKNHYCTISSATPEQYNLRRNEHLKGRLYVAYSDEDVLYQKKLSQQTGADIYNIDFEGIEGCAIVEIMTSNRVLIKELLLPEAYMHIFMRRLIQLLPAREYMLRTPACLDEHMGGNVRPFGMLKKLQGIERELNTEYAGYLGIAFD